MQIVTDFPYSIRIVENIFIPMADGTQLAAKLWLPEGAGPVPAILEYLPYRKRDGTRARDNALHAYLAGHGYACLRVDIRGSGDSFGTMTDEYSVEEQRDGVAAIAWIAAQDWCDGQLSMIGISWGGFNGLQIAARQPAALRSVITVGSTDDRYATDVHWIGGCLSKDNFDWSGTMMAQNDLPPDPAIVGPRWKEEWQSRWETNVPWGLKWLQHQRRDAYWKQGSVCENFSDIKVPVYAVSGWADNYSESVPRLLAGLTGPRLGLIGPWAHSFPQDVTVGPAIGWLQEVLRWCDHWMKGKDTGIMDEPMLRVWMQEGLPPATCYKHRPGRWVGEPAWPSRRIEDRVLRLGEGLSGPRGTAVLASPLWVGLGAGEVGRYGDEADWPGDQREDDAGSLVWITSPLEETVEILGAVRLRLRIASDKPQALLAVRLNDVAPDGASTRVTVGLLNLTHRQSHEFPEPLPVNTWIDVEIELDDIAHAFAPGQRIAVSVSTSYWPIAWPSPETATLRFDTSAMELHLPVRPERAEDALLRPFGPAEAADNCPVIWHEMPDPPLRRITRDLLTGRSSVDFPRWTYDCEMTDIGQRVTSTGIARHEIVMGDPLSAEMHTEYDVILARADGVYGHKSRGRLHCDATHFHVEVDLEISENGQTVYKRQWRESIARDHV